MADDAWDRNAALLRGRLDVELAAIEGFLDAETARLFPGFLGKLLNPIAKALLQWIGKDELNRRARAQLNVVIRIARDRDTAGVDEVFERHRRALLDTEELYQRANRSHPRFPELEAALVTLAKARLEALHGFLARGLGATLPESARVAYPDRADLAARLHDQLRGARGVVELVRRDPSVLRVPSFLQNPLFTVVDHALTWYTGRVNAFLEEIYGPPGAPYSTESR